METITDTALIKSRLHKKGVGFDVWPLKKIDGNTMSDNDILKIYENEIHSLLKSENLVTHDIVRVNRLNQSKIRDGFLREHIHPMKEVRIVTPKGCLIVLPDKAKHWADIGTRNDLIVIRFFGTKHGWSAKYTKSGIDTKFPRQSAL